MSPLLSACVGAGVGVAAWLSQGTVAFTGNGTARVGVLPVSVSAAIVAVAAAIAVLLAKRRGASLLPLWLLVLPLLRWLPVGLPPALAIWSGPLGWLVWLAAAAGMAVSLPWRSLRSARGRLLPVTSRPTVAAGVIAFAIYAAAAWQVSPSIPGGDEPHYLVITQSLLRDGDLKIENNHRRGDYRAYFAGELPPDFRVRGRNGAIYSIHAPGVSALVLPAFAIGGYPAVVLFLVALFAVGTALAWRLAFAVTGRRDAAWFGWAAVACSTTAVFHSFTIYPDGPGAVIALTGLAALVRAEAETRNRSERTFPWFLHGLALAAMPWLHTRFVLLAAGFGGLVLLRLAATPSALHKAGAFLSAPAVSAVAWFGYFIAIYGTSDPSAPYGNEPGSVGYIAGGLVGLLADQRFGLLAYSPVLFFALLGFGYMLTARALTRLGLELLFVLVPYLLAVTHFAMWWGGRSAPARFLAPVLLLLAVPAAVAWTRLASRVSRATALGALAFTGFASATLVLVDGGRLAFSSREGYALWYEWLNEAVDLARGLPSFWRGPEIARSSLYRTTAIWAGVLAAAWLLLRLLERAAARSPRQAERTDAERTAALVTRAVLVYATAATVAIWIAWTVSGVAGTTAASGQMALLRRLGSEPRVLALDLGRRRSLDSDAVPPLLRIAPPRNTASGGAGPNDRPLYVLPAVPAGRYRIVPQTDGRDGWLMLGIGRDQFSLRSEPMGTPPRTFVLDFPVDVRAIVVRGDEQAQRSTTAVTVQPESVVPRGRRLSADFARRAVRYGAATVYFLGDRSFAEPQAFWIGGGTRSAVVLQPDTPRANATLLLRNAPVDNTVLLEAGGWRDELRMGPGEERHVEVPLDVGRGATLVTFTTSAGFRPSEVDPNSRDQRFLGVWVQLRDQ